MGVSEKSPNDVTPAVTNYPLCAAYSGVAGRVTNISCTPAVAGRYVIIQIPGVNETLTLCEVEINIPGMYDRKVS